MRQPSRLVLVGPGGQVVDVFDSRSIKKYDTTIRCDELQTIPAGVEIDIGSVRVKRSDQGFALTWGPFEYIKLPAGIYTAQVVWKSTAARCFDDKTGQPRSRESGKGRSNPTT
jgi:hypothetical protein